MPDTEKTFEELKQRLAKTIDYVKAFKPAQFEGADTRDVTFPVGPTKTMTLKGQQFLTSFAFPNFYFHAATAHGILRHNGVEIGKRDFLGRRIDWHRHSGMRPLGRRPGIHNLDREYRFSDVQSHIGALASRPAE